MFRLANVRHDFPPDSPKLHPAHLVLSENDRAQALARGHPPLLSVFDRERCTVDQAKSIRGTTQESRGYGFRIPEILEIRVADLPPLRVLRDALDPPACSMPGADGHCGIEGLERPAGTPKQLYWELRAELAYRSFRLDR